MGFEVNKPSNFFINTLNAMEYIKYDIQIIEAQRIDDPIISYVRENILTWLSWRSYWSYSSI